MDEDVNMGAGEMAQRLKTLATCAKGLVPGIHTRWLTTIVKNVTVNSITYIICSNKTQKVKKQNKWRTSLLERLVLMTSAPHLLESLWIS